MIDIFSYKLGQKSGGGSGGGGGGGGGSNEEWIGDGNTHIWITLPEGRTSPMLGVCPNGTVTVDWGDGSTPDVLTGTSTSTVKWTPNHEYAAAGDYVITLTVNGEIGLYGLTSERQGSGLLRHTSEYDWKNLAYTAAIKRVELSTNVTRIGSYAFGYCSSLMSVTIPNSVTKIEGSAFNNCYSLTSVAIPNGVTSIGNNCFASCRTLQSIVIPSSVKSIGSLAFSYCSLLLSAVIPNGVTKIESQAFANCSSLMSATIPNSVTSIGSYAFNYCYSLQSVVIPSSVTSIESSAFAQTGIYCYDFTQHSTVPTLGATSVFTGILENCEIRVPAALADEWKAATNWSTYADYIVGV